MFRILLSILAASLIGCSRAGDLRGYDSKSGDLGAFILNAAPKYGVRIAASNNLPKIRAKWRYKETRNESFEVLIEGNYFPQLDAFVSKAVGPRAGDLMTNGLGNKRTIEGYYGSNAAAVVSCRLGSIDRGEDYTGFVIVSYGQPAFTPKQVTQSLKAIIEQSKSANEKFKALDAARTTAPYVLEFLRLFPGAEVNYRYFAGDDEPGFDMEVDLYERYTLGMQLPVHFDASGRNVTGYSGPKFYLCEAEKVVRNKSGIAETFLNRAGERRFGPDQWRKIVEQDGDLGAIAYYVVTNRPVPGFKGRKVSK